jgi:hypothetical protein
MTKQLGVEWANEHRIERNVSKVLKTGATFLKKSASAPRQLKRDDGRRVLFHLAVRDDI